jgi:HEAT repeat protein
LVARLDDPDSSVRAAVCDSLGAIGALEAGELLNARLADADWPVRLSAAIALRRLGMRGAKLLQSGMEDAHSPVDRQLVRYVLSLEDDAVLDQSGATSFS